MDENLLHDVVAAALKAGADAAEAVLAERQSLSITVRMDALEEVEREEARDLGVRVFIGRKQATVSGSDLSADARARLIERVVAMARLAPDEPYGGLAPQDRLARNGGPDLDLFDPAEPSADALEAQAREAEQAARGVAGVTNSDGGSAGWSASRWRLVTSAGFSGSHQATGSSLSASAIAGEGSAMERGGEGRSTRWRADLPAPHAIGAERPLLTGLAFGLTNPKAYPVALAMFSAIVAPYVDKLSLADAPRLMGAAFLGFLAADATLIFAAGLPAVRRFFLTHGVIVTRVVGVLFIGFGARSIYDAASGALRRG